MTPALARVLCQAILTIVALVLTTALARAGALSGVVKDATGAVMSDARHPPSAHEPHECRAF